VTGEEAMARDPHAAVNVLSWSGTAEEVQKRAGAQGDTQVRSAGLWAAKPSQTLNNLRNGPLDFMRRRLVPADHRTGGRPGLVSDLRK
jgi:hypothetical protein